MLSKSPSVAVKMISPNWTSKDVLSAASGLWQGQRRSSKVKEALQVCVKGPTTCILRCHEAFNVASTKETGLVRGSADKGEDHQA